MAIPVPHAAFYYLDKFVLLASGKALHLYHYQIDLLSSDSLIRQPSPGRARVAHSFVHDHAQKVSPSLPLPIIVQREPSRRMLCVRLTPLPSPSLLGRKLHRHSSSPSSRVWSLTADESTSRSAGDVLRLPERGAVADRHHGLLGSVHLGG